MSKSIFVSLTEQDTPIAVALRVALTTLVGDSLKVHFSTSKEFEGGPQHGEDWFQWIAKQVEACDFAFILFTPASVQKPWILWEAGAVWGAASAAGQHGGRKVRPLIFQITDAQLPSPIQAAQKQFLRGDREEDVERLFKDVMQQAQISIDRIVEVSGKLKDVIRDYLATVSAALLRSPGVPTSVAVDEWLSRLDALLKQNRQSEAEYLQDWMEIAFGSDPKEPRPIDLRLHARLGGVYLGTKNYKRAVQQFELARLIAPRDIYILRSLGRAYLETTDRVSAKAVLDRMVELDADVLARNAECAALAARYHREGREFSRAIAILGDALKKNEDSYYLANLLGEASLEAGDLVQAKAAFQQALNILGRLRERNVWTYATAANAAFVVGEDQEAIGQLRAAMALKPAADEVSSVERGLRRLAAFVPGGEQHLTALLEVLHPETAPLVGGTETIEVDLRQTLLKQQSPAARATRTG